MRALVLLCIDQHTKFKVPSLTNSKDMIGAKLKIGHVSLTMPIREYSVIESHALDIFYLHTKFGDCRFSCSRDYLKARQLRPGLHLWDQLVFRSIQQLENGCHVMCGGNSSLLFRRDTIPKLFQRSGP